MSRSHHIALVGTALGAIVCLGCSGSSPASPTPSAATAGGPGATAASSTGGPEYANVSNQGGAGVYAENGAMLVRQPDGLRASISMPRPEPGTYNYPAGKTAGHPEVFTLWAFVFNYPDLCTNPCNGDDIGPSRAAKGGVYNVGGHASSGNYLTIAGRIGIAEAPFGGAPLEAPATAEVHLAVAPHGDLDPTTLPTEFRTPTGPMSFWWIAVFH